jgi:HK97 family phage prohead protease
MATARIERRAATDLRPQGRGLAGRVATYGIETRIGGFREVIERGAFRDSLGDGRDILALADHDPTRVLARTRSGTLRLAESDDGLDFELDLPDTTAARDLLALAERDDLGGCSFGFRVPPGGDAWDGDLRTLRRIDLAEVSIVQAWPAYPGTSVDPRTARPALTLRRAWMETI